MGFDGGGGGDGEVDSDCWGMGVCVFLCVGGVAGGSGGRGWHEILNNEHYSMANIFRQGLGTGVSSPIHPVTSVGSDVKTHSDTRGVLQSSF